jgi:hypothetical protein
MEMSPLAILAALGLLCLATGMAGTSVATTPTSGQISTIVFGAAIVMLALVALAILIF